MEELMQYVWQFRLWPTSDMLTVDGRRIEVLDPGLLNRDAGPDFFNAKLTIGGQLWIGNVEMHLRASDWARHGHTGDKAYDSVVLHVVERDDAQVTRTNGEVIPQMVMACARDFSDRYHQMVNNPVRELACGCELPSVPGIIVSDWITALAYERLLAKADRVSAYVDRYKGNWADAVYVTLARALGFSTNAEPFELLAATTPLKYMLHHSDSQLSVEAILFGQAGLIPAQPDPDDYYQQRLAEEYRFMSAKFGLRPSPNIAWKMARMRPQNFPHRRIAALAAMIYDSFQIGNRILAVETEEQARALFDLNLTGYWSRHFNFSPTTTSGVRAFSQASITVLIINVVAPVLYAYGEYTGHRRQQDVAVELLQTLKPESNSVVDVFRRAGIEPRDAFTTQALIQLRRQYCEPHKCLFCRIGHRLLSQKVRP